ncbi:MAG: hypothetical protein VYE18_07800 [Pseudomonadota bacterium]|nr:hypothetical protein [Pseudomonadota bacterium]
MADLKRRRLDLFRPLGGRIIFGHRCDAGNLYGCGPVPVFAGLYDRRVLLAALIEVVDYWRVGSPSVGTLKTGCGAPVELSPKPLMALPDTSGHNLFASGLGV